MLRVKDVAQIKAAKKLEVEVVVVNGCLRIVCLHASDADIGDFLTVSDVFKCVANTGLLLACGPSLVGTAL